MSYHYSYAMSNREIAIDLIQKLPENASLYEVAREIEFIAGVREGFEQLERGEGVPAETVRDMVHSWIAKRLPGHPLPIGNLVNPQNHPVRNIKVDPLFLEHRARRFGQVEVVQDILAGSKPGFKSLGGCLIAHNMRFARFRVLGAR